MISSQDILRSFTPGITSSIAIQAKQDVPLRIAMIEVPAEVDYPLYREQ